MFTLFMILFMIIGFILSLMREVNKDTARAEAEKQANEEREALKKRMATYATCEGQTLYLERCSPKLADCIEIRDNENQIFHYEPKTYIYTSATVGGITFGGVDSVGGYVRSVGSIPSGKCEFFFMGQKITRIHLTPELFKEAEKDETVKHYLDSRRQQILIVDWYTSGQVISATASAIGADKLDIRNPNTSLLTQTAYKSGYPTQEKCHAIMKFICTTKRKPKASTSSNAKSKT